MRQRVIDEEDERFGQIGMVIGSDEVAKALNIYQLMFDDGDIQGYLSYQIVGVKDESG